MRPRAKAGLIFILLVTIIVCYIQLYTLPEPVFYRVSRKYFDADGNQIDIELLQDDEEGEPESAAGDRYEEACRRADELHLLVNINSADIDELSQLPGVGPVMAQRIIDYRELYGGFVALEELMEVKGIYESTFARISPYITLE